MAKKKVTAAVPAWPGANRFIWAFGSAFILLGIFLPWYDVGMASLSGWDLIGALDNAPAVVKQWIRTPLVGALPLVAGVLLGALAIASFMTPEKVTRYRTTVWWVIFTVCSAAALGSSLPAHTQKLGKYISFGHWITLLALAVTALATVIDAFRCEREADDLSQAVYPLAFLAVLIAALIINYSFVNYTLVPKAPDILRQIMR